MLLPDVWKHIIEAHPEIEKYLKEIGNTLAKPFVVYRSRRFTNRHLYYKCLGNKLFFTVVVDMAKGIVKTSYITDRIKEGEIIWQEKK